jgi:hypothetical protein
MRDTEHSLTFTRRRETTDRARKSSSTDLVRSAVGVQRNWYTVLLETQRKLKAGDSRADNPNALYSGTPTDTSAGFAPCRKRALPGTCPARAQHTVML